jgi:hypothetical protein
MIPIAYLCYTGNYYEQCINQEPMLINHIKSEIGNYIEQDVNYCWNEMGKKLQKEGYVVDAQRIRGYDIELKYDYVEVVIDATVVLTKSGESTREELFKARTSSKTYNIVRLVQEIVSQEAVYCNFENVGYMTIYPEWKITKFRTSDSILIYTVENKKTNEKFRFAIRGCVLPGGL